MNEGLKNWTKILSVGSKSEFNQSHGPSVAVGWEIRNNLPQESNLHLVPQAL